MEVDAHTAFLVGEAHFKQCSNKTTCRDVMSCHNPSLLYHVLNCIETVGKVFWVLYGRNIIAHEAKALCESATTKTLLVE